MFVHADSIQADTFEQLHDPKKVNWKLNFIGVPWFCHRTGCEEFDAELFVKNVDNS